MAPTTRPAFSGIGTRGVSLGGYGQEPTPGRYVGQVGRALLAWQRRLKSRLARAPFTYKEDTLLTKGNLDRLTQPIDPSRVKQREGGRGTRLSYIEAHDAIRTANEIFGIGGWYYTVEELVPLGEPEKVSRNGRNGFRAGYRAVVKVTIPGTVPNLNQAGGGIGAHRPTITFSDVGYGDAVDYSGSAITVQELAMKEAVSDGVKRALKNLGDQFGLSLYDKEARANIEARSALVNGTDDQLKRAVWKKAKEELGKEKPTAKQVAAHFKVSAAELTDRQTMLTILGLV